MAKLDCETSTPSRSRPGLASVRTVHVTVTERIQCQWPEERLGHLFLIVKANIHSDQVHANMYSYRITCAIRFFFLLLYKAFNKV